MNNRRRLVIALGVGVVTAPLGSLAQPQGKVWRIGFLGRESAAGYARELEAFRAGLKDFGYLEGKNLVVLYRWAEGVDERLPQLAAAIDEMRSGGITRAVIRHPLVRSVDTRYGSSLMPDVPAIREVAARLFPQPGGAPEPWPTPKPSP